MLNIHSYDTERSEDHNIMKSKISYKSVSVISLRINRLYRAVKHYLISIIHLTKGRDKHIYFNSPLVQSYSQGD